MARALQTVLIHSEKLDGLKVETEGGQYIGRVHAFDFEVDTQSIRRYYIKPTILEGGMFSNELIVHHKQVVAITEEKMVVVDNIVKYDAEEKKKVYVGTKAEV